MQLVKAWTATARTRAVAVRQHAEGRRDHNRGIDVAFTTYELDRQGGGSLLSAALAFRLFLWLLPVCLVVVAGLGYLSWARIGTANQAVRDIGITSIPAQSINQAARESSRAWWLALLIGVVLLYAATSALIRAVWAAHALIWRSPGARIQNKLRIMLVFLLACCAVVTGTSVASVIRNGSPTAGLIAMLLDFFVYAAAWWFVTTQLPHGDAPYLALIPGAVLFGAGVQAMHLVTVYYLARRLTSASELYGTLGVAAALLLGLYFVGRLIIVSAEFSEAVWTRWPAQKPVPASPGFAPAPPASRPAAPLGVPTPEPSPERKAESRPERKAESRPASSPEPGSRPSGAETPHR
jgi:uncharacterized BrkB/YihY/UPF0761 family membrane protein